MSTQQPIVKVEKPTAEESFYVAWALETFKSNLTFANEVLRQLVTICVAVLGGSFVFLDQMAMPAGARVVVAICFVSALVSAIAGILPHEGSVDIRVAEEIKLHKSKALGIKMGLIKATALFLCAGFIVGAVGLWMKATEAKPPANAFDTSSTPVCGSN